MPIKYLNDKSNLMNPKNSPGAAQKIILTRTE